MVETMIYDPSQHEQEVEFNTTKLRIMDRILHLKDSINLISAISITKEDYFKIAQKFGFTKRELKLGFLKVSGFSNRRIAYMHGISEQTVKNHFTHIYE